MPHAAPPAGVEPLADLAAADAASHAAAQPSEWMQRSLALARQAIGLSNPNPAVGCVIVSADGRMLLGQGHTQAVGGPHAEVMALRDAAARGHSVRGAQVYVTLEPCAHHGRTPPCCDALVAAGVARVVASLADPNPQVAGQGLARLRAAGIAVELGDGQAQASDINVGFLQRMATGRPWVRAKAAASLDGMTALPNGQSQWITSAQARRDGQAWRQRACVVLTGIGTVLADDPLLNVRDWPSARQPHLAIADSALRTPLQARLWQVPGRQVLVFGRPPQAAAQRQAWQERRVALQAQGAQVVALDGQEAVGSGGQGGSSGLDLAALIAHLGRLPINEIHVEAGARLNGGLLQAGLVDEWLVYLAPKLLGAGRPIAALPQPWSRLEQAARLHWHGMHMLGDTLRLQLRAQPLQA